MTAKEFVRKLRRIDPRFVFIPGPYKSSGLYLKEDNHEDSVNGLRWVAALPSPRFFGVMPEVDWMHPVHGYVRGWRQILRILLAHGHIPKDRASKLFGSSFLVDRRNDSAFGGNIVTGGN